jgi:glucose-1-phosphate thymidylyltransferase
LFLPAILATRPELTEDDMRGVIAAGGPATRIRPAQDKSQQIVYDKPVLFYLLTNVMKARIRDVMIVCNERNVGAAESLFRDADWELGLNIRLTTTPRPDGPAGVFRLPQVKRFIGEEPSCLMLDGIYHGGNFDGVVQEASQTTTGATILAAETTDPRPFGWLKTNETGRVINIVEKPVLIPKPNQKYLVQTHMYFYGPEVVALANKLQPSKRGEYEVTDLHKSFLRRRKLSIAVLRDTPGSRLIWDDAGTAQRLLSLAITVQHLQERSLTSLVGSPHLQAFRNGWITRRQIQEFCASFAGKSIEYYDSLSKATD